MDVVSLSYNIYTRDSVVLVTKTEFKTTLFSSPNFALLTKTKLKNAKILANKLKQN